MKRILTRSNLARYNSFTLVELLVVIAIIAILAATTLQVAGPLINSARRARAQNTATQIQTACLGYYTEYSVYPVPGNNTGDYLLGDSSSGNDSAGTANKTAWKTLICILCGNIHPSDGTAFTTASQTITNSRGIPFLNLRSSDVYSTAQGYQDAPVNPVAFGAVGSATGTNLFFNIAMDGDYDGVLGTSASANTSGKMPNFALSTPTLMNWTGTSTAGIAVWENCNGSLSITNPNFWVHTY